MASPVYTTNFESATIGTTPTEFVNQASATWKAESSSLISGGVSFSSSHVTDGDVVVISGTGAPAPVADGTFTYSTIFTNISASIIVNASPLFRMDSGYSNGYLMLIAGISSTAIGFTLYKRVGGSFSSISVGQSGVSGIVSGTAYRVKVNFVGSTINCRAWLVGTVEPTTWNLTLTDATFTSGYTGFYNSSNGTANSGVVDDIQLVSNAPSSTLMTADLSTVRYTGAGNLSGTGASARWNTINSGSIVDLSLTVTDASNAGLSLNIDGTGVTVPPTIRYSVDGGVKSQAIATVSSIPLLSTLSVGTHSLRIWVDGLFEGAGSPQATIDEWTNRAGGFSFAGINYGTGITPLIPAAPVNGEIEFLGDSITASVRFLYTGSASDQSVMDSANSWPQKVADTLTGYNPIVRGFGATGPTSAGSGGVPNSGANFPYAYASTTYTPPRTPKAVVIYHGTNNGGSSQAVFQAAYLAYLQQIRAVRPAAKILAVIPSQCSAGGAIYLGIQGAFTAFADPNSSLLDASGVLVYTGADTTDGTHVGPTGATKLAQAIVTRLQTLFTAGTINVTQLNPVNHTILINLGATELRVFHVSDEQIKAIRSAIPSSENAQDTTGFPIFDSN